MQHTSLKDNPRPASPKNQAGTRRDSFLGTEYLSVNES